MNDLVNETGIRQSKPIETRVWRYLDFSEFVSLLETRAIHFSSALAFEDQYDGVFNCLNADDCYDVTNDGKLVRTDGASLDSRSADNSARFKEIVTSYHQAIIRATGVSCWSLNDHESHAMWCLYVKSGTGVAIESTLGRLKGSITAEDYHVVWGEVEYIDYTRQKIPISNLMNAFFYKDRHFEHEKELRLICYRVHKTALGPITPQGYVPLPEAGLDLPVDVHSLIQSVCVSPYAPKWFSDLVTRLMPRYELSIPVHPSAIALRRYAQR